MDAKVRASWEALLDPQILRPRLIRVAIFVLTFEMLKDAIVDRLKTFFHLHLGAAREQQHAVDPEYQADVLSRNRSTTYASLAWLKDKGAIDADDLATFDEVKRLRNKFAHELHQIVGESGLPENFDDLYGRMVALLRKVEVWWIKNVEMATDPDWADEQVDDSEISPGSMLILQMLSDVALGPDDRAKLYLDHLRKLDGA